MSTKAFHISTSNELLVIKDRVRNLINHWGEDGRYKEAVLKSVIQRFLPGRFAIASGFVTKQAFDNNFGHKSSRQIDLIVYDTNFPVLFRESDFVIVTPDSVRAIIEVKANLRKQGLEKVLKKSNLNGKFIFNGKEDNATQIFNGIFSFEGYNARNIGNQLQNNISKVNAEFVNEVNFNNFKVNHISFNKDLVYKYWVDGNSNCIYENQDLSFSFFISYLMDFLSGDSVFHNHDLWFSVNNEFKLINKF